MKKTKIIIPALGMLLLSTAASITGTVAWFSMNNFVTATGMQVKAKAENGIVISNAASDGTWKETAASAHATTLALKPTSTATGATWVHSKSNDASSSNTQNGYELLSLTTDSTTGAGYVEDNGQQNYQATAGGTAPDTYDADSTYYAMHSFYIKSSAESITNTIYITNVKATLPETQNSADLNKALRVLVRLEVANDNDGSQSAATAKVYSPVYAASSYNVATATGAYDTVAKTAVAPINASAAGGLIATASQTFLSNQVIPANNGTPLHIGIYLYFEGEDPNCKSDNLTATLDNIQVEVTFGTQTRS